MTTTRKDRTVLARQRQDRERMSSAAGRRRELILLIAASVVVSAALVLVYRAQLGRLNDFNADVKQDKILILTRDTPLERIEKQLRVLDHPPDRRYAAQRIRKTLQEQNRLPNVGTIGRVLVSERDLALQRDLVDLTRRIEAAKERAAERQPGWIDRMLGRTLPEPRVAILSAQQLAAFKPSIAARGLSEYTRAFLLWCGLYIFMFYAAHVFWRIRGFAGDNTLLPLVHLITGLGLALMVSLRDPVRDTMIFRDFSQGVLLGGVLMIFFSLWNYDQLTSRYTYLPLVASILLAAALFLFGSGPGGSGAKVNLLGFQPVEAMRLLLVLFLAGYFGRNWDVLREMRQQSGPLSGFSQALHIARFDYMLPVFAGVVVSLALFFALHDMGPALVIGCLFLGLYSIARNSFRLAGFGLTLILFGFLGGYVIGHPDTVRQRTAMWLSIWDNSVRGGDQISHSLWSFATGEVTGTGLGLGHPQSVPAGHTDLILSVFGEQFGWIGFVLLFVLYGFLIHRSMRIALRAPGSYSMFLAAGLTLITAGQLLIIAGGILGLAPLSGVVTPFLSYGRSSMMANFAILGMLLAISSQPSRDQSPYFAKPMRIMGAIMGAVVLVVLGRAGYYQLLKADQTMIRGALVMNADGVRRYEYNPRIMAAVRMIPKGDIFDRNDLPLATSDYAKVDANTQRYAALGVNVADTTAYLDRRHYPLGPAMFYVLGDTRSPLKRGARNTAFEEARSRLRLQGFDDGIEVEEEKDEKTGTVIRRLKFDYSELLPLIRHRWEPDNPEVRELLSRPRDVKMSIDSRLQLRVSRILESALRRQKKERGAIAILDPATGDLLASVSYPLPSPSQMSPLRGNQQAAVPEELLLDRARYGLYPPGSSFKIVTAVAALRRDPALLAQHHDCVSLPDGRVGNTIKGMRRPIRDDVMDRVPHGKVDLSRALVVSCNAYFAQLGFYEVGAASLLETAREFGITAARPNTVKELQSYLPQSSYGQGEVVATPFQMARVAATIANAGAMPYGRWIVDESNARTQEPKQLLTAELAVKIADAMRGVVTSGTGKSAAVAGLPVAGKTGTAELGNARMSHAWFIGFAGPAEHRIAFAVLVENGQYGGRAAAPIAAEVIGAARELGLFGALAKPAEKAPVSPPRSPRTGRKKAT
ncbi:MAG TPA: FtsW/RodA/SpoVE family cell cycle protein [Bryobacteraceae bacterium]|nr:FtsW/RodA/SpoVE family cell cycle protein [Bryobacteraceae bacterium]